MIRIEEKKSLEGLTTFGLPSVAEAYAEATTVGELAEAFDWAKARGLAVHLLGGGSNTIALSEVRGVVLRPAFQGVHFEPQADGTTLVIAGAAERLDDLVRMTVEKGLWGLENFAAIPGSIGGAVVQNAGAYGVELAERFAWCRVWDPETQTEKTLDLERCDFGYRTSVFKGKARHFIITEVALHLPAGASPVLGYKTLAARLEGKELHSPTEVENLIRALRAEKLPDPAETGSAGSFFKNPVVTRIKARELVTLHPSLVSYPLAGGRAKLAAGWLIDAANMRAVRVGGAGVWPKHALVLVNVEGATSEDVIGLAREIVDRVERRFGVLLEPEPVLLGGTWADYL